MGKKLSSFSTYGRLEKGNVIFDNRSYWLGMLKFFDDCKHIRISIERVSGGKTQKQLGYLYGHLYEVLSAATGYTVDEVDEVMKGLHGRKKRAWRGRQVDVTWNKRTSTSDEMMEFIDKVFEECVDLGLQVEPPDKEWRVKRDFPEDFNKKIP